MTFELPPFEFLYTDHDLIQIFGEDAWEKATDAEQEEGFDGDRVLVEFQCRQQALNAAVDRLEAVKDFINQLDAKFWTPRTHDLMRDINQTIEQCNDPQKYFS